MLRETFPERGLAWSGQAARPEREEAGRPARSGVMLKHNLRAAPLMKIMRPVMEIAGQWNRPPSRQCKFRQPAKLPASGHWLDARAVGTQTLRSCLCRSTRADSATCRRQIDPLDIIAALQTGNYLRGPYAAADSLFAERED